jgi:hypothetical protein
VEAFFLIFELVHSKLHNTEQVQQNFQSKNYFVERKILLIVSLAFLGRPFSRRRIFHFTKMMKLFVTIITTTTITHNNNNNNNNNFRSSNFLSSLNGILWTFCKESFEKIEYCLTNTFWISTQRFMTPMENKANENIVTLCSNQTSLQMSNKNEVFPVFILRISSSSFVIIHASVCISLLVIHREHYSCQTTNWSGGLTQWNFSFASTPHSLTDKNEFNKFLLMK